jgi:hypothetical protein
MKFGLSRYLAFAGSVVLLAGWLIQQFAFDRVSDQLSRLSASEALFHQYRSNNLVFAAMREAAPGNDASIAQTQTTSFMIGVSYLLPAISPDAYDKAVKRFGDEPNNLTPDAKRLREADILQLALIEDRTNLYEHKERVQILFWLLNLCGTVLILAGALGTARREVAEEAAKSRATGPQATD